MALIKVILMAMLEDGSEKGNQSAQSKEKNRETITADRKETGTKPE